MDADNAGRSLDHLGRDEILARRVRRHDRLDQILRHILVIGEHLLRILGQAIAAIAEGGIVIETADPGVETHALDHLARVDPVRRGIGVEFVEEGDAHREIGVGEQLDRLGLCIARLQDRGIGLQRPFEQQACEFRRARMRVADDDPRGIEIVVKRAPFAQEFGRKDDRIAAEFGAHPVGKADRHGRFDDDQRVGRHDQRVGDDALDRACVEIIGVGIIIGRRRDHDEIRAGISRVAVGGRDEVQRPVRQMILDLRVGDRRLLRIELLDLARIDVARDDLIVLRQQYRVGNADIARADDGDLDGRNRCRGQ